MALAAQVQLGDLPDQGLVRGQVGTTVERLDDETVEVEFGDDEGRTYAMLALRTEQLMVRHHRSVQAA